MKSGTRKVKNESKRNRDHLDMAAKTFAEFEEAQRRRQLELERQQQRTVNFERDR